MSHIFRAFFYALPSVAGILLATLAFALVFVKELDEKLKDKRRVRWALALVLSVFGISGLISDLVQRSEERTRMANAEREQKQAVDGIKEQLSQSEIQRIADVRYLQGKLDVFAQFAPAVVKLAQATEENTRKQYEQKVISNKQLRDLTADVVRRMRDFVNKYSGATEKIMFTRRPSSDPQERDRNFQQEAMDLMQETEKEQSEFKTTILGDALFIHDLLLARLGLPRLPSNLASATSMQDVSVRLVFSGERGDPHSAADAANYLENLAKRLSP